MNDMNSDELLHFATIKRMAAGLLLAAGALLMMPHTLLAQDVAPRHVPLAEIAPEVAPVVRPTEANVRAPETMANISEDVTQADVTHVIAAGDTLTNVAQRYNVTLADLAAYNQIVDLNHVMLGQELRIPPVGVTINVPAVRTLPGAEGYHVMRQGEALGAIARQYGVTLDELLALNEIENPNLVRMGTLLRLTAEVEAPAAARAAVANFVTYTVKQGDTLSEIAQAYATSTGQITKDNKLADPNVYAGQELRIYPPATALTAFGVDAPVDGARRIVIDLGDQTLTAYQGDVQVLHVYVSTGKAATPTLPGEFAIYQKLDSQHMTGDDYDLPGVPWVMYYFDEFAIHGAYWHANFGVPTSHGCTNMTIADAQALYRWAPLGTPVTVQW